MRKLVYLVLTMLLLGKLEAASACRFFTGNKQNPSGPQEQLFEIAYAVFVGHVIRTDEVEPLRDYKYANSTWMLEATLRIKEVLKASRLQMARSGPLPKRNATCCLCPASIT